MFKSEDYRDLIIAAYQDKKTSRKSYSIRAFATLLKVPVSTLSMVLNKKAHISEATAKAILNRLDVSKEEKDVFWILFKIAKNKNLENSESLQSELSFISQYHNRENILKRGGIGKVTYLHLILLELSGMPNIKLTSDLAVRLVDASKTEVQRTIQDLIRTGYLADEKGILKKLKPVFVLDSSENVNSVRDIHLEITDWAKKSILEVGPKNRVTGSETFLFSRDDLESARKIISDCFLKLSALGSGVKSPDGVYCAFIHLFPVVTKDQKN